MENIEFGIELDDKFSSALRKKLNRANSWLDDTADKGRKIKIGSKNQVDGVTGSIGGMSAMASRAIPILGAVFAADKVIDFGRAVFETTAEFQKFDAVYTNTLGGAEQASRRLRMIEGLASRTPFALQELIESDIKLINYGFEATESQIIAMGDFTSAMGKSFDQYVEAIADAMTGENERLKEFGIKARKSGDMTTFTFREVETQVNNTEESIRNYLLSLGKIEGISGQMAGVSATLGGQLSNLEDNATALRKEIGLKLTPVFEGLIKAGNDSIDMFRWITVGNKTNEEQMRDSRTEFIGMTNVLKQNNISATTRSELIDRINTKYGDYLPNLLTEKTTLQDITTAQLEFNKSLNARAVSAAYNSEMARASKQFADALKQKTDDEIRKGVVQEYLDSGTLNNSDLLAYAMEMDKLNKRIQKNQVIVDSGDKKLEDIQERQARAMERFKQAGLDISGTLDEAATKIQKASLGGQTVNTLSNSNNTTTVTGDSKRIRNLNVTIERLAEVNLTGGVETNREEIKEVINDELIKAISDFEQGFISSN